MPRQDGIGDKSANPYLLHCSCTAEPVLTRDTKQKGTNQCKKRPPKRQNHVQKKTKTKTKTSSNKKRKNKEVKEKKEEKRRKQGETKREKQG